MALGVFKHRDLFEAAARKSRTVLPRMTAAIILGLALILVGLPTLEIESVAPLPKPYTTATFDAFAARVAAATPTTAVVAIAGDAPVPEMQRAAFLLFPRHVYIARSSTRFNHDASFIHEARRKSYILAWNVAVRVDGKVKISVKDGVLYEESR